MTAKSPLSFMNSEFEDFLFALVGEQKNGMSISTISAFARLDIDPWGEATRLTELPKERAVQALRESIARLADLKWTKIDAAAVAARLVRLLPSHGRLVKLHEAQDAGGSRTQAMAAPGIVTRMSYVPVSVWMAVALAVMVTAYFAWSGDGPSPKQNSKYDSPVLEQRR